VFGGPMPAAVLYMKKDFIDKHGDTAQALVNALYKTLKWMEKATPEQIAGIVPEEYLLGDRSIYMAAVKASLPAYSKDGIVSEEGQKRSLEFLRQFDPAFRDAKIDLARTWDGRFVKKAAELIK
jgi:NitT/TauT family transport system substrate-binding protein